MATTMTPNTVPGLFKEIYEESGLVDALPNFGIVQERVKFKEADMTGDKYVVGVKLQFEQGFTYGPSSGASTLLTLNAAVAGYIGRAQVEGYQVVLRSRIDYASAFKASQKGKKAFAQAYQALMENMKESFVKRQELVLLYGQQGLGKVETNTSGALLIYALYWAPGIWSGMKDAILEAFTAQTASATQHNGDLTISAVDIAARTITVTGTSAAVAPDDHLYFKGSRTTTAYNEAAGIDKILENTGTLFNISASSYELWKANLVNVAGNISITSVLQAINKAVNFGLSEDCVMLISPAKWAQLNNDEAALVRYKDQGEKAKRGVRGIVYTSGAVDVEIIAHPFMKESEAFLMPLSKVKRIGAADISFAAPGGGEMVVQVTDQSAWEIRAFSDQAIFIETPAQCVKLYGIT
jgi:hypothetical protein